MIIPASVILKADMSVSYYILKLYLFKIYRHFNNIYLKEAQQTEA